MTAPSPRLRTAWRVGSALAAAAGSAVVTSALVNRSRNRSHRKQAREPAGDAPEPTPVAGAPAAGEVPEDAPATPATHDPVRVRSDDLARAIQAADAVEAAPSAWTRAASELRARTAAGDVRIPPGPPTPAVGTAALANLADLSAPPDPPAVGTPIPLTDPGAAANGTAAPAPPDAEPQANGAATTTPPPPPTDDRRRRFRRTTHGAPAAPVPSPPEPTGPPPAPGLADPTIGTPGHAGATAPPGPPGAIGGPGGASGPGPAAPGDTGGTGAPSDSGAPGGTRVPGGTGMPNGAGAPGGTGAPRAVGGEVRADRRLLVFIGVAVAVAVLFGLGVVVLGGGGDDPSADRADATPTAGDDADGTTGTAPATTPVAQLTPAQAFTQAAQRLQAAGTFAYEGTSSATDVSPVRPGPWMGVNLTVEGQVQLLTPRLLERATADDGSVGETVTDGTTIWGRSAPGPDAFAQQSLQTLYTLPDPTPARVGALLLPQWFNAAAGATDAGLDSQGRRTFQATLPAGVLGTIEDDREPVDAVMVLTVDQGGNPAHVEVGTGSAGPLLRLVYDIVRIGDELPIQIPGQ